MKGKSALAISRDLGLAYKSAFVLLHKLREAMAEEMKGRKMFLIWATTCCTFRSRSVPSRCGLKLLSSLEDIPNHPGGEHNDQRDVRN